MSGRGRGRGSRVKRGGKTRKASSPRTPSPPPSPPPGSDEEPTQQEGLQEMHSSSDQEDDPIPLVSTKKSSAKNRWSIKDPKSEIDLIEWYKDNTYLWLITDKDYMNHAKKSNALEDKAKELGVTAEHINAWWKSNRDTYTKLSKRKSGKELPDLPYKQKWILNNFAFLKQRPTTMKAPVVSISALVQQHPGDLEAVETDVAEECHSQIAASVSGRISKSRSEEADFQEALLRSLDESRGTIAGMMKSASTSEDDYLTQWGSTVVASMRRMSKKRGRAFRKDVNDLLHKYSPCTSEDDTFSPPRKTMPSNTAPCTL
ncbi:uncharacterized protein [Amphiura filiformis]|uniref:uncharacterized protein n=1 Tax=Amphiura filiformis TaxID=82378 RepID=UPI003B22777B